jgi:very-short-patch-repair endonuclease
MSALESLLEYQIKLGGLPEPIKEHRFHDQRRWRFDFAWPHKMFAVEVEGGAYVQGRHTRGSGFEADLEKYHEAMRMGWTVYRCSAKLIKSGQSLILIERILNRE